MDLTPRWEYVSDQVMGGVSSGALELIRNGDFTVARLTGEVSLENNGGFVQMAFDLRPDSAELDGSNHVGIAMEMKGNGAQYDIRLRTSQLDRPWQSFKTSVTPSGAWTTYYLPFEAFDAHRTQSVLDVTRLRRLGILGIGRVFEVDVSVRQVSLY